MADIFSCAYKREARRAAGGPEVTERASPSPRAVLAATVRATNNAAIIKGKRGRKSGLCVVTSGSMGRDDSAHHKTAGG